MVPSSVFLLGVIRDCVFGKKLSGSVVAGDGSMYGASDPSARLRWGGLYGTRALALSSRAARDLSRSRFVVRTVSFACVALSTIFCMRFSVADGLFGVYDLEGNWRLCGFALVGCPRERRDVGLRLLGCPRAGRPDFKWLGVYRPSDGFVDRAGKGGRQSF